MKQSMLKGILCLATVSALASCTDGTGWGTDGPEKGTGKIVLAAELDASVISARSSRAEYSDVQPADLALKLTDANGKVHAWKSVADFPVDSAFAVGSYTLEAFYGDESTEGFESPYFYGKQDLRVEDQKTTPVALTAALTNSMVEIVYTDEFKNYMTSYSAEVHSAGGAYTQYAASETRPVYTQAGQVSISVDFVKPNGKGAKIDVAKFTAKPKTLHRVTVDLGGNGAGTADAITITFDETLNEESVEIDISDEVLNAPAPIVTAEGFTPGEAVNFVAGLTQGKSLKANIIAQAGLSSVVMTTLSTSLLEQGWPDEIDLIGASDDQQHKLKSLGFDARGVFKSPDKLAVLDFSNVLSHIAYKATGSNATAFTIVAKDRGGRMCHEPLTLNLVAEELTLSLDNAELYVGGTTLYVDLHYNAGKPDGVVTINYFHSRGVYTNANATFEDLGNNVYRAKCTVEASANDVKIQATAGNLTTPELIVMRKPMVAANGAANTFAKKAYVPVTIGRQDADAQLLADMMNAATVMVSTDGTNFTATTTTADPANKALLAEGLAPNTTYTAKIKNGSLDITDAPSFTFTTEAATQLPNAGMEEWYRVDGGTSHWWIEYPGNDANAVWGTMNLLTTSQGGSISGLASGASYSAFSGTRQTTDSRSGLAAVISTVGWGNGNTAYRGKINTSTSIIPNGGKCEHLTVGELYLGHYDSSSQTASYDGIAFASRPNAMSFFYKYVKKNSADWGVAEIRVLDNSGSVIVQKDVQLTEATSTYKPFTVELPAYNAKSAKAAKIIVIFKSSGNSACQAINNDNLSSPPSANLTDGRYTGSELYIDDIELIY